MPQTTYIRPAWVKPGEQWTPGETYEQYVARGGVVAEGYKPSTPTAPVITPDKQKQLQEIQNKINEIKPKIAELQKKVPELLAQKNLLTQNKEPKTIDIQDKLQGDLQAFLSSNNLSDRTTAFTASLKPLIDLLQADIEAKQKAAEERKGWMDKMAELLGRRTKTEELMKTREGI